MPPAVERVPEPDHDAEPEPEPARSEASDPWLDAFTRACIVSEGTRSPTEDPAYEPPPPQGNVIRFPWVRRLDDDWRG